MGKRQTVAYDVTFISVCVALIVLCSWISIPFFIHYTLQTFAIFLIAAISDWKRSLLSVLVYLMLGIIGVPVFAGFQSGISALLHATGGYLVGFVGSAIIISLATNHWGRTRLVMIVSMLIGLLFCYATGTLWFVFVYAQNTERVSLWTAISTCCLPFFSPDLVKILLATTLAPRIYPRIHYLRKT